MLWNVFSGWQEAIHVSFTMFSLWIMQPQPLSHARLPLFRTAPNPHGIVSTTIRLLLLLLMLLPQVRLPYAALPATASAKTNSHEGTLAVSIHVDKSDPTKRADVGSKPWLLSSALEGGGERKTGRPSGGGGATAASSAGGVKGSEGGDDALPEDRFHLRLPPGRSGFGSLSPAVLWRGCVFRAFRFSPARRRKYSRAARPQSAMNANVNVAQYFESTHTMKKILAVRGKTTAKEDGSLYIEWTCFSGSQFRFPKPLWVVILAPSGVNQYTGAAEGDDADNNHDLLPEGVDRNQEEEEGPIGEGESLPEERFHRADIVSQHMIDTREQQRKEKVRLHSLAFFPCHGWTSSACALVPILSIKHLP